MTDQLYDIKRALKAAKPEIDADKKATAIALARKKFEAAQELAPKARPIHKPTQKVSGIWTGVLNMIDKLTSRPALYATSFLCLAGLTLVITRDMLDDPNYGALTDAPEVGTLIGKADGGAWDAGGSSTGNIKAKPAARAEEVATSSDADTFTAPAPTPAAKPRPKAMATPTPQVEREVLSQSSQGHAVATKRSKLADSLRSSNDFVAPTAQIEKKVAQPQIDNETFAEKPVSALKTVADEPVSTFSIDVDTAAYSYVRAAIQNGQMPNADAVRIEELVNYFPYDYPAPDVSEAPFSTSVNVFQTPWNPDTNLLHIGIQGAKPVIEDRPPLNLVFLIDTSGSMEAPNKLGLLKKSFRLLLSTLRPTDKVAIVTYAGSAGMALQPTEAQNKSVILSSLENLRAGGSTAGQAGLQQAYSLAEEMHTDGSVERVLLATDGDFNVGINNPDALKSFVEKKRNTGVYLSVFGFGRGNYRDDMMQSLAQNGNGTAAYIDTLAEAQKVLVDQVSGALFPIANDVKIQVEFNPAQIAEYRLIGYETRALNREDFNNDKVDAGEIGAGHTVTAIYEITPVGSPAVKNNELRYGEKQNVTVQYAETPEFGFLKLRYKEPGQSKSKLIETPIVADTGTPGSEAKFAAAIAGFGELLTSDTYLGDWGWDDAIALALEGKGSDEFGYRAEAIQMMRLAKSIDN